MARVKFNVAAAGHCDAAMQHVWRYKLQGYAGSGTASVHESLQTWATRAEAQAVCDRVNAGDESGVTFACYADD